jgi:predicted ATPase/DNA-binding winged helix-turn-helix (wHTH) protein
MDDPRRYVELIGCTVDLGARVARWPDGERALTPTEAKLVQFLASLDGRAASADELLQQVWGYRAGVVSRTIKTTVNRLRGKIERNASEPEHLLTVAGLGYRLHLPPTEIVERAREEADTAGDVEAPLLGADTERSNLAPGTPIVGRAGERAEVLRRLREGERLLTVVGPGGAGKSALMRAAGLELLGEDRFQEVIAADLAGCGSADAIVRAVALAIGARPPTDEPRAAAAHLGSALARRGSFLLLLDDCEAGAEFVASAVSAWLGAAPRLAIVASSREPLRMQGEHVVRIGPLPLPDAVRLFEERAGASAHPGYRDPSRLEPILRGLDGLPLAIEMAATWADVLPPDDLLARLGKQLDVLRSDRRDRPARHESLRASVASSWELLSAWERAALLQLAVFPSGFSLDDAEDVLDLPRGAPPALAAVRGLIGRSLVHAEGGGAMPRFRLWAAVRAFAMEEGRDDAAETRHARRFARWGSDEVLDLLDRSGGAAVDALADIREDLVAAVLRAVAAGELGVAVDAVRALSLLTALRGPVMADAGALDAVLAAPGLAPSGRAAVLLARGALADALGDAGPALRDLRAAREAAAGADGGLCVRIDLALASALRGGDPPAALQAAETAAQGARALGNAGWLGRALLAAASLRVLLGQTDAGLRGYADALQHLRAAGDRRGEAVALERMADVHLDRGRPVRALSLYEAALERQRQCGDLSAAVDPLDAIARVLLAQGDLDGARTRCDEALAIARRLGNRAQEGRLAVHRAAVERQAGRLDDARKRLVEALALVRAVSDRPMQAEALVEIGEAEVEQGRTDRARAALGDAIALSHELGLAALEGVASGALAEVLAAEGRIDEARPLLQRADALLGGARHRVDQLRLLERWAQVEANAGDEARATAIARRAAEISELSVVDAPADPWR